MEERKLIELTIEEAKELMQAKKISCVELVSAFLNQIENTKNLNALISLDKDGALNRAREVDKLISEGKDLPLLGIPVIVKDNISTTQMRTTCASKFLENYIKNLQKNWS